MEHETEFNDKEQISINHLALYGLSKDYTIAFVVNLDTDEYRIVFNHKTNHAQENNTIKTFTEYVALYADQFVLPAYKETMKIELGIEKMKANFEIRQDYHFTFETLPNSAGLRYFQAHIVKEYTDDKKYAFLGFRSIDDVVKKEREYQDTLQHQLDLITFALPGGVKISNDDETYSFKYVSEQFAKMLGYDSPEELIKASGGNIVGLAHPDDFSTGLADALDQYSRNNYYATTYRMRCKDGSYKYIEDRGQKVISENGTIEHWNLILDKNDLMEKDIELKIEKKSNQSKTNFLSRMSHDMRTPLNGILGLLQIDEDHLDDTELIRENHKKMKVSAEHLLALINDVLQMSKIETGNVPLTNEVINFRELSRDIIDLVKERAKKRGIVMEFYGPMEVPYNYIYGSPVHLRQIFLNIYGNCIKYNRVGGKIITTVDHFDSSDGTCNYRWTISDTGIGMSKEFLKHIFEPFTQEKDDARTDYQGSGLGMPIVKGLLQQMEGTISVISEEGVGTTFIIILPIHGAPDPIKVLETETGSLNGLNLMLVEDNELNAEIAELLLTDQGAEVSTVYDGQQAVDLFTQNPKGTFDVILMDIMMPVMDGITATQIIRALDREDAKTIPIVALTANAFKEDEEKCLAAGMNAHLAKPIDMEKLQDTIRDVLSATRMQ